MTSTQASPAVAELRSLFRYLQEWRSLYEQEGIDEILTPRGQVWSLWDLEYLYTKARDLLTDSQYRALTLFLVYDFKEQDAAEMMGVSRTNPIGMYAALGLSRLVDFVESGGVERFRSQREDWQNEAIVQAMASTSLLAKVIREQTESLINGCLRFTPTPGGHIPRIRLKTPATVSGLLYVHPMNVLYVADIGPIPTGYDLRHIFWLPDYRACDVACVNYEHAHLVRKPLIRRAS
jgi:hypothetical protein